MDIDQCVNIADIGQYWWLVIQAKATPCSTPLRDRWPLLTLSTLLNPSYSTIMASINDPDEGGSIVSQDTITTTTLFALDDYVRKPTPTEPRYKGKNKLFYCLHCF